MSVETSQGPKLKIADGCRSGQPSKVFNEATLFRHAAGGAKIQEAVWTRYDPGRCGNRVEDSTLAA
jgi:hypothetical protein